VPAPGFRQLWATALAVAAIALLGCGGDGDGPSNDSNRIPRPPQAGSPIRHETGGGPLTVAAAGDFGIEAPGRATLEAMARAKPDLDLALGDLSYAGPGSEERFCRLVRSKVGPTVPFEIVSGNHEEDTGGDGRIDNFARCLPDSLHALGDYGKQYYFDLGRLVRFIMISPDLTIDGDYHYYGKDDDGSDNARLAWLSRTINGARAAGIKWVVVGMHKPCITVGVYYCDVYQDLFSRLIEEKVDLVMSGHDHTYQRSKQIAAPRLGCRAVIAAYFDPDCVVDADHSYRNGAGSALVVTGAAGAGLYPVHPSDPEAGYFAATMGLNKQRRHGFVLLTISPQKLAVRFVGSTPGSFGDRFEIASGDAAR
jgi:3',5'-cyclic AMP phosphodiesterase CpdA